MGLLDDAIREHLELKRRSGEDSRRLAQLEHEAFGPIRRGDPALDLDPPSATPEEVDARSVDEDPFSPGRGQALDEPARAAEPEPIASERPAYDPPGTARPEPYAEPAQPEPLAPEPSPQAVPPPEPEPEADVPPAPRSGRPSTDQPTAAFSLSDLEALSDEPAATPPPVAPLERASEPEPDPERPLPAGDVVPADDEPGEHDLLEDTPEFLEETPEHDRLWFEQRPPRDFDF